jgi:hypothetical protein
MNFAKSTPAPQPKTHNIRTVSIFYAIVLVVMAVLQLFSYEHFAAVFDTFRFPGGQISSVVAVALLVTLEVAALPFLLSMQLSRAARVISMVACWLVAIAWLKISLWTLLMVGVVENSGLLGATIAVPGGTWLVFFSLGLCTLAAWTSWGMWPGQR